MGIPSAVTRQAEEAERIRLEALTGKPAEEPEETPVEVTPPEKKVEEPPKEDWKEKHDKLYGQYSELIATNKAFAEELSNMRMEISALRATKEKEPEKPAQPESDEEELQALKQQFPEASKLIEIQLRRESARRDKIIESYESRVQKLETGVSTVEKRVNRTEGQTFEEKMDGLVKGDWRKINDDREFGNWLKREKIMGHTRWDLFQSSLQQNDPQGVAEHFNDYIKLKNPSPEPPEVKAPPPEEENIGLPRPGTGVKPVKSAGDNESPITRSYIKAYYKARALRQDFYWNKALKARNGDKKAWEKINAEIELASNKGAVIEG